jgi:hypothetical protein
VFLNSISRSTLSEMFLNILYPLCMCVCVCVWSWNGSVSIVSYYRPDDRVSISGSGERIFPLSSVSRLSLGATQPPVQLIMGVLSPGVRRGLGGMLTTRHMSGRGLSPLASAWRYWDIFVYNALPVQLSLPTKMYTASNVRHHVVINVTL